MITRTKIYVLAFALCAYIQTAAGDLLVSSESEISVYSSINNTLLETVNVDQAVSGYEARDLIRLSDGRVAVFNGVFDPKLSIWNQQENSWLHYTFNDWGIANNVSYGGIATDGKYIYVVDSLEGDNGIIRFDQDTGSGERFLEELSTGYIDVSMGLDGYIYALRNTYGDLDKIDPSTMQLVSSFDLGHTSSSRAVAVDIAGNIYMASWSGYVAKFSSSGMLIDSSNFGNNLYDIDIHPDGQLAVSDRFGSVFYRDLDLAGLSSFSVGSAGTFVAYSGFDPIDSDSDGVPDVSDNCPRDENPDQADSDFDMIGDVCETDSNSPGDNENDDFLLTLIPSIVAAIKNDTSGSPPEWGVINSVCCPGSRSNFSLTLDGTSLTSSVPSCSAEPTFQGFRQSTSGSKSLSGWLSSSRCGNLPYSLDFAFKPSTQYLFSLEIENSRPVLVVYEARFDVKRKGDANSSNPTSTMVKVKEVWLSQPSDENRSTEFEALR